MSEGGQAINWSLGDEVREDQQILGVGRVMPGVRIRVCDPHTRSVLKLGELGELHIGGTTVINGYLGGRDRDKFYVDAAGQWFTTGDQAKMDVDGTVYVTERYKDIIIRGGKNISPAVIEACLQTVPDVIVCTISNLIHAVPFNIANNVIGSSNWNSRYRRRRSSCRHHQNEAV